jgi:5-methyltetrahydrofolate--homocysteine methyltransferase
VSFSFRGNEPVREAIHTVFLYHAIKAGMDMGIVNAGMVGVYDDSTPSCASAWKTWCSTAAGRGERLVEIAERAKGAAKDDSAKLAWRAKPVEERLSHALVHGITDFIVADTEEVWQRIQARGGRPAARHRRSADGRHEHRGRPVRAGQDVPAAGGQVGARDEAGRGPPPALHRGREAGAGRCGRRGQAKGKIVIATVKGDVHDIGKNIVTVVLQCNNFEVVNMGVMVPCQDILARAKVEGADIIGLSGLITPSLEENAAQLAERCSATSYFRIEEDPMLIGGATTSRVQPR